MKKYIPNILTTYRLIVALLIPFLFFKGYYNILSVLFIIALLSDAIDGILARRWNVTSNYGKICDAVGDKLLALSSSATFIIKVNKYFIITLILELVIVIINFINYVRTIRHKKNYFSKQKSSICGKTKTWFLFVSLFVGYTSYKIDSFDSIVIPLVFVTAIMQILTALSYLDNKYIKKYL